MKTRRDKTVYVGNIDARSVNEDWPKVLRRDVDAKGKKVPNRFDEEARLRGEKFTPILEHDEGDKGDRASD